MNIEFYKHNIGKEGIKNVVAVLKSLFLTTGSKTEEFEREFSKVMKAKYAVGLSSCTEALFLSLIFFGIKKGDEVITTPLSFIATANAIEYTGAKPVFVDVNPTTGNLEAEAIEKRITKRTRAIIVVHLYGQMVDMPAISKLARKNGLKLIEDSAHCIEGEYRGIKPGMLSDVACFSFYATKNITSGEGGAIVTNNRRLYEWFLRARLHGMSKNAKDRYKNDYSHYDMEFLGYKANMTDLEASLLLSQLPNLNTNLARKETLAKLYEKLINDNPGISLLQISKEAKSARHLFTVLVDKRKRDLVLKYLNSKGIGVAVNFRPIHLMQYYRKKYGYKKGDFPNAEDIGSRTISLPFYTKLKKSEIAFVVRTLTKAVA